ncbi:MAG: hypothetical protein ACI9DF_006165 [Verrucomicrobiales bacterium]
MRLTDNLTLPSKFIIPTGTSLPAGGYRVFLAGDETGFNLSSDGESVYLISADGASVIDQITFGCLPVDLSIGRVGGANALWALNAPTPGSSNRLQLLGNVSALKISDWLTQTQTKFQEDFVELYNPETLPIAIR